MTVRRKDLKGAVKRGLLHRDAVDGPVPEGGPRRWTCLACGRDVRRNGEVYPRLFGCGCCGLAWEMEGLQRTVAAGGRAVLLQSGAVGIVRSMNGNMAVFVAEGGDAEGVAIEAKALAPIYQHKTAHAQGCIHSPMPSGIGFTKRATKETPMAVKKFVPKGKPQAENDVVARLVHIFSTAGGTTAAQAVVQVSDLGTSAESSVEQFLASPPPGYELQKRSGEGGAAVYRLASEQPGTGPGGTQYKEGMGMATATVVRKATSKKKAASTSSGKKSANNKAASKVIDGKTPKKLGVIAAMRKIMAEKPCTKEQVVAVVAKLFPDRASESMASTFSTNFAGKNPVQQRLKGHTVTQSKKDGVIYYQVKLVKAIS